MHLNMKSVKWWKVGAVRILAVSVIGVGIHGISYNFTHHTLFDFSKFSGPTAFTAVMVGLALFVLGYRTERDYEQVSSLTDS